MASETLSDAGRAVQTVSGGSERTRRTVAIAAMLLIAIALPFLVSNYRTFQLTLMIAYAIALLGLNILTGYNGQISLGHGAFFALGSYVAAIMMDRWDLPYWSTLPAAGAACFVAGFLFGLPALRLEGLYLALATFALAVATPQILKHKGIEDWTGGVQGINILKPQAPWHLPLSPDQWLYFFALGVAVMMFVVGSRLVRGRVGRALVAIRDNPTAAATMGVNTALYKTLTFGVSALFTGIAGALNAIAVQFVAPDSFGFLLSISFLVGIVIGGFASISGAIYGAFFIEFVPNIADSISKSAPWAVYGAFLVASVYFMPNGIAGVVRGAASRIFRARAWPKISSQKSN
jgi:branched-chain amino acid transport system permease protein